MHGLLPDHMGKICSMTPIPTALWHPYRLRYGTQTTFCSVCSSRQQALINRRLLAGESLAMLSADHGLPVPELRRHRDEHVLQRGTQRRPRRPAPLMD